ncbi:MAG: hypothetical protein OXI01_00625 [Albidovulum sp.]|nr:hypothetical protein [Albidovulum sp.]
MVDEFLARKRRLDEAKRLYEECRQRIIDLSETLGSDTINGLLRVKKKAAQEQINTRELIR